jgi:hypothetical protein
VQGHSAEADNEASEVGEFAVTFHALANHHGYLSVLDPMTARPSYDDTLVDRSKDPEAGAFSYHLGRDFYSLRDLEPGDEIFLVRPGKCFVLLCKFVCVLSHFSARSRTMELLKSLL